MGVCCRDNMQSQDLWAPSVQSTCPRPGRKNSHAYEQHPAGRSSPSGPLFQSIGPAGLEMQKKSAIQPLLALCCLFASSLAAASPPFLPASAERVYSDQVGDWIFAVPTELQVCDDGRYAAFGRGYWYRTIDLTKHESTQPIAPTGGSHTVLLPSCTALNTDGKAWKASGPLSPSAFTNELARALPQGIVARPSPDGSKIAYFTSGVYFVGRPEGRILHVGRPGSLREVDLGEPITGVEWMPDSGSLIALLHDPVTGFVEARSP